MLSAELRASLVVASMLSAEPCASRMVGVDAAAAVSM
jgi:hypothetical protein